jgi:hypothetical protein
LLGARVDLSPEKTLKDPSGTKPARGRFCLLAKSLFR